MKALRKTIYILMLCVLMPLMQGCLNRDQYILDEPTVSPSGTALDLPDISTEITPWDGTRASDASEDVAGADASIYHETNTFAESVEVIFSGDAATVKYGGEKMNSYMNGAHVVLDFSTPGAGNAEVIVSGKTANGSLKIYSKRNVKLVMNGVDITSCAGPAINCQVKKSLFIDLAEGTVNRLTDSVEYGEDVFSLPTSDGSPEDRKGCLFSEADVTFSGTGVLCVTGCYRHGIAVDGFMVMRPGVTVVVEDAVKNGVSANGDGSTMKGVEIRGGYLYSNTSGVAGKALKCDRKIVISGKSVLNLNCSGDATFVTEEDDTSSATCLKTDAEIEISGGTLIMHATGAGGKGINAVGDITFSGGDVTVTTSGEKYEYGAVSSSPKGVKTDGSISVRNARLRVYVATVKTTVDGMDAFMNVDIAAGADVMCYASGDAVSAGQSFNMTGGRLTALSVAADGIDCNGDMNVSGGEIEAVGGTEPESGIDVKGETLIVSGDAKVIAYGGTAIGGTAVVVANVITDDVTGLEKGKVINLDGISYSLPRSFAPEMTASVSLLRERNNY